MLAEAHASASGHRCCRNTRQNDDNLSHYKHSRKRRSGPDVCDRRTLKCAGSNAKLGQGLYIVAEADESDASFLNLSPVISVVTNIDEDHMDTYGHDLRNLRKAFTDFIQRLPFYGRAVMCIESENVRAILPKITKPILTYGFREELRPCRKHRADGTQMHFTLVRDGALRKRSR